MNGRDQSALEVESSALNDGVWHEVAITQTGKVKNHLFKIISKLTLFMPKV